MEYNAELRKEIEKMKAKAEEGQKKENSSVLDDDIEMIRKTAEETIDQLRHDSGKRWKVERLFALYMLAGDSFDEYYKKEKEDTLTEEDEIKYKICSKAFGSVLGEFNRMGWIYKGAAKAFAYYLGAALYDCIWYSAYEQMQEAVDAHYLSVY